MHTRACIHVFICVKKYTYVCDSTHTHVYMYTTIESICTHTCTSIYTSTTWCAYVCDAMHRHMYVYVHMSKDLYMPFTSTCLVYV